MANTAASLKIEVRHFGAFRKLGLKTEIEMPWGCTLDDLKAALVQQKGFDHSLVHDSAFANESQVLAQNTILKSDSKLAVLPPVCGG